MDIDLTNEIKIITQDLLVRSTTVTMDKGMQDIVTNQDFEMERAIKAYLRMRYPDDAFIGEEENQSNLTNGRTWVCDPIDGTLNYTNGHPFYGVQLALLENKVPLLSLIYLPQLNELYYAQRGSQASLNGERLSTDACLTLSKSVVTFGDFSKSNPSSRQFQLNAMGLLMDSAMRIRIQGASSVDFAFVSSSKTGCHILFSKNLWELAPGLMLAEASGCKTYKIEGIKHGFEGQGLIIAANQTLLDEVIAILNV